MPKRIARVKRRRSVSNHQARRVRGEENVFPINPPTVNLGEPMPLPNSKGKVLPSAGEPVTDIRIYPV